MGRALGRRGLLRGIVAVGTLAVGCGADRALTPDAPPRPTPVAPRAPATPRLFDVHVSSWLSLHLILHELGARQKGPEASSAPGIEAMSGKDLPPAERASWDGAVAAYAAVTGGRDPVFDRDLERYGAELAASESSPTLSPTSLPPALVAAVESAMPVYKARWWARHEANNRALFAGLEPQLQQHGAALTDELARAYRTPWPAPPPRLDIVPYANWAGAFTTLNPLHLIVASVDDRHAGSQTLEIVLHEASHGMIRAVRDDINREVDARGKDERSLWHAILFFTTGEIVRRRVPGHVPYAEKHGLYTKRWADYRAAMEKHWTPWLDGKVQYQTAVRELIASL